MYRAAGARIRNPDPGSAIEVLTQALVLYRAAGEDFFSAFPEAALRLGQTRHTACGEGPNGLFAEH